MTKPDPNCPDCEGSGLSALKSMPSVKATCRCILGQRSPTLVRTDMLRETYLTQRLRRPRHRNPGAAAKIHQAFGGGMLQLSDAAWDVLYAVCTLDHMGAAEYEFGVLPRSLHAILEVGVKGNLATFAFVLGPHERKLSWERQYKPRDGKPFPPAGPVRLYGIAHKNVLDLVKGRVRTLAKTDPHIKQGSQLTNSLDPISPFVREDPVVGWVELDNGFLFFCDEIMWRSFCTLLGAEPCDVPEMPAFTDYRKMLKPELVDVAVSLGMFHTKTAAKKAGKDTLLFMLMDAEGQLSEPVELTPEMFGGGKNEGKLIRLSSDFMTTGKHEVVEPT